MGSIIMEISPVFYILLASVLSTFLFFVGGSGALRDVEIAIPRYVRRGDDVKLTCNYNQERDQIYAVNWYRANQEFYRYVPKEVPPQKAFHPLPGSYVDVRRSNDHDVYLKNISLDISGLYKCSATAEQSFQTLSSSREMTVVVIGDDMPFVQLDRAQYHPGDVVTAECQSPPSNPVANITWYLQQEKDGSWVQAGPEHGIKTEIKKSNTDPVTRSLLSRFSFDLPVSEKTSSPAVSIKCRVTIFTFYDQNSTIQTVAPTPRRLTGTDTLLRPGTSSSSTTMLVAPDSALRFLLVLLPLGISTSFFFSLVKSLNGLASSVIWSLLYPFYYFYHHHRHHHYSSFPSKRW